MKFKKIMLITLVLLAVITMGAVSAIDDADFNETLTVDTAEEVSADAPLDENVCKSSDDENVVAAEQSEDVISDGNHTGIDINPGFDSNTTRMDPGMHVNVEDTEFGEPVEIGISFDYPESGTVDLCLDNSSSYTVGFSGGRCTLSLPNLNVGTHQLEAYYAGDLSYTEARVTVSFNVFSDENSTGGDDDEIRVGIWDENDERGALYTDSEGWVVNVDVMDGSEGTILVIVNDEEFSWDIQLDDGEDFPYHEWSLEDLNIAQAGDYAVTVKLDDEIIANGTLHVSEFNNDAFRLYINYENENFRLFCPENSTGTAEIIIEREDDDGDLYNVNDENITHEITFEDFVYGIIWYKDDLGIEDGVLYRFTVSVKNIIDEEVYRVSQWFSFGEGDEEGFINYHGTDMVDDADGLSQGYSEIITYDDEMWKTDNYFSFRESDGDNTIRIYINDNQEWDFQEDNLRYTCNLYDLTEDGDLYILPVGELNLTSGEHYVHVDYNQDWKEVIITLYEPQIAQDGQNTIEINPAKTIIKEDDCFVTIANKVSNQVTVIIDNERTFAIPIDELRRENERYIIGSRDLGIHEEGSHSIKVSYGGLEAEGTINPISNVEIMIQTPLFEDSVVIGYGHDMNMIAIFLRDGNVRDIDGAVAVYLNDDETPALLMPSISSLEYDSEGNCYWIYHSQFGATTETKKITVVYCNGSEADVSNDREVNFTMMTPEYVSQFTEIEIRENVYSSNLAPVTIRFDGNPQSQAGVFESKYVLYVNGKKVDRQYIIFYPKGEGAWDEDRIILDPDDPEVDELMDDDSLDFDVFNWLSVKYLHWACEDGLEIGLDELNITSEGTYDITIKFTGAADGADELELISQNIKYEIDPDYASVEIRDEVKYRNDIPFLFEFEFAEGLYNESNRVLIYINDQLAFNSSLLYYEWVSESGIPEYRTDNVTIISNDTGATIYYNNGTVVHYDKDAVLFYNNTRVFFEGSYGIVCGHVLFYSSDTIVIYDENEGLAELTLLKLHRVVVSFLDKSLFNEYGFLDVGEYEAVVYLVKGDNATPIELGRNTFTVFKQKGNFTFDLVTEDDGHTYLYADVPEGNWEDYSLTINIGDSEEIYPETVQDAESGYWYWINAPEGWVERYFPDFDEEDGYWPGWITWFNEYCIFENDQIILKEQLDDIIGKGRVPIDLGILAENTHVFVSFNYGREPYYGLEYDCFNDEFTISGSGKVDPEIDVMINDAVYPEAVEITISAPINATGMVIVTLNNRTYSAGIVDGTASVSIPGLNAGNYTASITYEGDEKYNSKIVEKTFTVAEAAKMYPEITVTSINYAVYPEDVVLNITAPSDATSMISVTVNGINYTGLLVNGKATVRISGLDAGNYTGVISYPGDEKYFSYEVHIGFSIAEATKIDPEITVEINNATYGENVIINIIPPIDATGMISVTVGNGNYSAVANGTATIIVSGLDAGSYDVLVNYSGDVKYNSYSTTVDATVAKAASSITANDATCEYGQIAVVPVTVDGATGVNASVMDHPDVEISYSNDEIHISGLGVGNYTLTVATIPDSNHIAAVVNVKITVNKISSTVSLSDIVFDYGSEGTSTVTSIGASDITAEVVNHTEANVNVDGSVITVSGLDAGTYTLKVTTVPDANHTVAEASADITVNKVDSVLTVNDASCRYGESVVVPVSAQGAISINASLVGYPDAAISYLNDEIVISGLTAGNYTLKVSTIPDKNHNAVEATAKIAVNRVIVTSANFNEYFNENGELIGDFPELIFTGEFAGKQFNINKAVALIGEDAKLTNTRFNIHADNVSIRNMELKYQGANPIINVSGVSNFTLENNNMEYDAAAFKASAVSISNSDIVNIKDNYIKASGAIFVDGILVSSSNFTIESNTISVSSAIDAEGINIIGSGNGNVKDNNVNVIANKTVYGINTTATYQLNIIFVFNVIYGEGIYAVGINDDSEVIGSNKVTLKAVQATGVIVNSENAEVTNNDIKLISADPSPEEPTLQSTATGVQVNAKSTVSYNTIDSFDKSVSVDGGCASEVSYNTVNAPVTVSAVSTSLVGNDIETDKDKAVIITDKAADTVVDNNVLSANGANGDDAVSNEGTGTTISNNKAKLKLAIEPIADIIEGQGVVIVISADKNFTGNVTVQVANKNTTASLINGSGKFNVAASQLSVGEVLVKVVFGGNDRYANDTANTTFTVKAKTATKIKASAVTTTYGTSKNIVITLTDTNGNALAGKQVTVVLNGASKTLTTDSKGQASYAIGTALAVKKYDATFTFNGDANYAKTTGTVKVTVDKAKAKLTATKKTFKAKKKTKKYTVTLKTDKGKALKKAKVTLTGKFNGKKIKITVKTNSKGKATFNLKKLTKKGKFTAQVKFAGNTNYKAVTKKVKITVK